MEPQFIRLNREWNAEPVDPRPVIRIYGNDLLFDFELNAQRYDFEEGCRGVLRFRNCSRYRLGGPNDEGFYYGQGRFSASTHEWGEFYLVYADLSLLRAPADWVLLPTEFEHLRHFLFYMKDETFECAAEECLIEPVSNNALYRKAIKLDPVAAKPASWSRSDWAYLGSSEEPNPFMIANLNVWAHRWHADAHHVEVIGPDGNRTALPVRSMQVNGQVVQFLPRRLGPAKWEFYVPREKAGLAK